MSGPKRILTATLSDDLLAIETAATSDRSCRRKKAEARKLVHILPALRLSLGHAVSSWPLSQQEGLFMLTMIIRLILIKFPHYRQMPLEGCNIVINGRRVEQSFLFRSDHMPTRRIDSLCKAMAMMHCTAPRSEHCSCYTVIVGVIRTARTTASTIVLCCFLLEFSALCLHKSSQKALLKLSSLNAMGFATYCWDSQVIPITC